jgi:hypothetical protein
MVGAVAWFASTTVLAGLCRCPGTDLPQLLAAESHTMSGAPDDGSDSAAMPCHPSPERERPVPSSAPCPDQSCCRIMAAPVDVTSQAAVSHAAMTALAPGEVIVSDLLAHQSVPIKSQIALVHGPPVYIRYASLLI